MRTIVIFSGAGLSAESGIPTFRASDGLWENHKVTDVASPEGWFNDPELVLKFYEQRFYNIHKCEPNAAHLAIAKLQEKFNVVNITQNIDDLLERAGCKSVYHLHGCINQRKCEHHSSCTILSDPCDYIAEHIEPVKSGDKCPKCDSKVRPNVVWFGEPVDFKPEWVQELVKEVKYNDGIFITVGTSAQVYPAASLIPLFSQVKNKYIINPEVRPIADYTLLKGTSVEILPGLVEQFLTSVT